MSDNSWQPQLVAFVCQWCTYAGADLAGTSRMQYEPHVRIVKVPCSSRIDPLFLIKAFEQGADGVLVSGCHPGDCHYVSGNLYARRRFLVLRELLAFVGLEPQRLQFSWVSAAEGAKWTQVVHAVTEEIRQLGPGRPAWAMASEAVFGEPPQDSAQTSSGASEEHVAPPSSNGQIWQAAEDRMRLVARRVLESGDVAVFVGYGQGSLGDRTRPVFVSSPADVDELVWTEHCLNNLSVYLTRDMVTRLGKVGIALKGCDAKALVALMQEHQVRREDVFVLGMPCLGMVEDGRLLAKCVSCDVRTPLLCDELVEATQGDEVMGSDARDSEIAALEALTAHERWTYWQEQFRRCIRCYACRAVCPLCYCDTCIADKTQPQWISPAHDAKGNMSWNLVRALHLAGRCVGCDECARICPAGIRLDLINRKLALLVSQEFGFRAGYDAMGRPPLSTYQPEDPGEFIR